MQDVYSMHKSSSRDLFYKRSFFKTVLHTFMLSAALVSCGPESSKMPPPPDIYSDRPHSSKIDGIYVFGDSLSDTGNFFYLVNHLIPHLNMRLEAPPSSPTGHRFSNQYLAAEYVAAHYGLNLKTAWNADPQSIQDFHAHDEAKRHHVIRHILAPDQQDAGRPADQYKEAWDAANNLKLQHSGGNNYAVANGTIGKYPGLAQHFYNKFHLAEQVSLHARHADRDADTPNTLHLVIIGGNDLAALLSRPATEEEDQKNIGRLARELRYQVQRLQDMGARKVLVMAAPDLGIVPAFFQTPLQERATRLSHLLDQAAQREMETFAPHHVRYASLPLILYKIKNSWHGETAKKCVSRELQWPHFLETDGEISVEFTKNCNARALNRGDFIYFDHFHGTDALYRQASRLYIDEIEILMKTSEVKTSAH